MFCHFNDISRYTKNGPDALVLFRVGIRFIISISDAGFINIDIRFEVLRYIMQVVVFRWKNVFCKFTSYS